MIYNLCQVTSSFGVMQLLRAWQRSQKDLASGPGSAPYNLYEIGKDSNLFLQKFLLHNKTLKLCILTQ